MRCCLVLVLILLAPLHAVAAEDILGRLDKGEVEELALMINLHDHMCAQVTKVFSHGQEGVYVVECKEYHGGCCGVRYLVDTKRGVVSRR